MYLHRLEKMEKKKRTLSISSRMEAPPAYKALAFWAKIGYTLWVLKKEPWMVLFFMVFTVNFGIAWVLPNVGIYIYRREERIRTIASKF
jgi:hypothetical protein